MRRLTILSERQKSITGAVEANFPIAFHGFCLRHLSESFRKEFNNTMLVNILWEAANAHTVDDFDNRIRDIVQISQEAANVAESLNSWILEASARPLIQMLECICRQLMTWFVERREASTERTSVLVPHVERFVLEAVERGRTYQVLRGNEAEFEVISHEGTNMVDIRNRCCSCRGWQLYSLPCAHAHSATTPSESVENQQFAYSFIVYLQYADFIRRRPFVRRPYICLHHFTQNMRKDVKDIPSLPAMAAQLFIDPPHLEAEVSHGGDFYVSSKFCLAKSIQIGKICMCCTISSMVKQLESRLAR
ncbi:hypothetical protein ACH5RR_020248 [Cinchona calisaya]|uniref:SWIM-type domain-containing protein n=1 Tax=Cinchona calisaya TaxID=153742 RepID=A0ABD2ZF50_9GENT